MIAGSDPIEKVIKNTIEVMDQSKYQVFEICENARNEKDALERELQNALEQIKLTIEKVDQIELNFSRSRIRLSEVSRNFSKYGEEDVRKAYEIATQFQMDLILYREKESHLRSRRDELQRRIRNIETTIERAENVVSQMNVVSEYLSGDLSQIVETAKNRQMMGLKVILAQEEERRRIAREIHDGLAQSMANVVLRTEITERMLETEQHDDAMSEVKDLKSQLRSGLEEIRKIIFNLRPMALDDLGIVPTLRKFIQDFEEKHGIKTSFEHTGKEARVASAMEVAIFRFVQEAFSNVLKHANATHIEVEMAFQPEMIKVRIYDNGIGFSQTEAEQKAASGNHFGLVGMRERVEILDGVFRVDSKPQQGTTITMLVPVDGS